MSEPCLCGDPYCPRCGNPFAAQSEAAEQALMERLAFERLSPDEYALVGEIGLQAVKAVRAAVAAYQENQRFLAAEAES